MALAFSTLAQGSSTTDATSYALSAVTPAENSLVLCFLSSQSLASSVRPLAASVGAGSQQFRPVAHAVSDGYVTGGRSTGMEVWAMLSLGVSTTPVVDFGTGNTHKGLVWALIQITGTDLTSARGAIRQVATAQSPSSTSTLSTAPAFRVMLAAPRDSANNGVILGVAHFINEATTPGSGMTELADQTNADVCALEVSYKATWTQDLNASWATATANWCGIGLEIAVPSNTQYVSNPESVIHA